MRTDERSPIDAAGTFVLVGEEDLLADGEDDGIVVWLEDVTELETGPRRIG